MEIGKNCLSFAVQLWGVTTSPMSPAQFFRTFDTESIYGIVVGGTKPVFECVHKENSIFAVYRAAKSGNSANLQLPSQFLARAKSFITSSNRELKFKEIMACKAIGIDLGTTYSCAGVFKHGRVEIIANNDGNRMTPSCVAFTEAGILVGDAAMNQLPVNAANTVHGVKRMMGRRFNDQSVQNDMKHWPFKVVRGIDGQATVEVRDIGQTQRYSPETISSLVLGDLKRTAEYYLGHFVTDAVITVPANYGDAQRQATFDAARLVGLNVLRIVNEPTAAALAYGLQNVCDESRNILVFDLGGGTLDVSILSVDMNNHFTVKATAGNSHLGGDDFDNRILAHFVEEFKRRHQQDLWTDGRAVRRLYATCRQVKRRLSQSADGFVEIDNLFGGRDFRAKITREEFEVMCADLFRSTIAPVEQALADAKLKKGAIDEIVLVGGSSRIPKIQQLLQDYLDGRRLNKSINPDEAIAYGAAILAAKLSGTSAAIVRNITLSDIIGVSLGMMDNKGEFKICLPHGSFIPVKVTQTWRTADDYQKTSRFYLYEGEDSLAKNNHRLGTFDIGGHPSLPAGKVAFEVVMEVDINGVLHVSATEKSTGKKNQITFSRRVAV